MKIRNNLKLKSFKLHKILGNEIDINNTNKIKHPLYNSFKTNYFNNHNNIFIKDYNINSTEIQEKNPINKNENKKKKFNYSSNNKKNTYKNKTLLNFNKNSKIYLFKSFDNNNITGNCFSVPQTLNYYGRNIIKSNAANAVMKMNNFLLKNKINVLSLPKNPKINTSFKQYKNKFNSFNKLNDNKVFNMKKNNFLFSEDNEKYQDYFLNEIIKNKRKKISLFEKEKKRQRERYNNILKDKFAELEACEKQFNIVIENTLQKLNDEEKNLY